ncbi:MAG TPA: ribonuclease domain-containing protein [Burkholderiales bacterium]
MRALALGLLLACSAVLAFQGEVRLAELPREAQQTLALVRAGGPFPYARDGVVFGNREGRLPRRARGYYHEYTVPTAGRRDRGARRIVAGRGGEFYYSDDHYRSFRRIIEK